MSSDVSLFDWKPAREAEAFARLIARGVFSDTEAVEIIRMTARQRDFLKRHAFVPAVAVDQLYERRRETVRLLLER